MLKKFQASRKASPDRRRCFAVPAIAVGDGWSFDDHKVFASFFVLLLEVETRTASKKTKEALLRQGYEGQAKPKKSRKTKPKDKDGSLTCTSKHKVRSSISGLLLFLKFLFLFTKLSLTSKFR